MIAFWTILHGLVAIFLLGAITHQGLSVWRKPAPARGFVDRFRAVNGTNYANAVVVLYLVTFALGAWIYPPYVLDVKSSLFNASMNTEVGLFQIKEHMTIVGLATLPVYWELWRRTPLTEDAGLRRYLTTVLMVVVWWNLVVGHILNNIKGLV